MTTIGQLPTTIEAIDSAWLTGALRRSGQLSESESVTLQRAEPLTSGTAFSTLMYRLFLEGPASVTQTAILKLPVTGPVRALLDGISAYRREVTFYRELAPHLPVRVVTPYIAEIGLETTDFVLLLEDLRDLRPGDQLAGLTLSQAEYAVDYLAAFHAWGWEHERLGEFAGRFPPLDSPIGTGVQQQFGELFKSIWPAARAHMGGESLKVGDRLADLIPGFIAALHAPKTIAHGELRAENLFLSDSGALVMVDFQTVAQQAGIVDLAYLISQSLPTEVRRGHEAELVRRYHRGLQHAGVRDYDYERAWTQYRLAVAFNLVLPGVAFMTFDSTDDRGRRLLIEMLHRASAAINDNNCVELIGGLA
jgi:hypothetical protein